MSKEKDNYETIISNHLKKIQDLQKERTSFEAKIENFYSEVKNLRQEKIDINSKLEDEISKQNDLKFSLKDAENELNNCKTNFKETIEKLNKDLVETKKMKIQLQAELDSQNDKYGNLLSKIELDRTAHEKEVGEIRMQTKKMMEEQKVARGFGGVK